MSGGIASETARRLTDRSGAQVIVPIEHNRVHAAKAWQAIVPWGAIAGNATVDVLLSVPELQGPRPHLRVLEFGADSAPFVIGLYEAATVSANGTPITARNKHRGGPDADTLSIFQLLSDTLYLVRMTNESNAATTLAQLKMFWYMED